MSEINESLHKHFMLRCIELARVALERGDSPVGSLVVRENLIVAEGVEAVRARGDVTAHAEIEAVRAACQQTGSLNLTGCTLYTSVEPCVMCAYVIRQCRISAVVMGARTIRTAVAVAPSLVLNDPDIAHGSPPPLLIRGVLGEECLALLTKRE